jgi:hypothetical protein
MAMKTKTTSTKAAATSEYRPPINAFIMFDPVSHLLEILDTKSKIAVDINLLLIEFDKKVAQAKIDLDSDILKLMKKTK